VSKTLPVLRATLGASAGLWKPIDTAPQDGTWILMWDSQRELAVSGCWHTEPAMNNPESGYEPGWSWWSADDDVLIWDGDKEPTHWMPLPNPPIGDKT
jgi:hypothetical protein